MKTTKRRTRKGAVQHSQAPARVPDHGVFIIESFEEGLARNGMLDGQALSTMLKVCLVPNQYRFVRTASGLQRAIAAFRKSNYSFLHLSCHGTNRYFRLQDQRLGFAQLAAMLGPVLRDRRLFLSVCKGGRLELAQRLIPRSGCYSILGTPNDICMDDAAVLWSTFYYLMNRDMRGRYGSRNVLSTLHRMSRFFKLDLNYFAAPARHVPESVDHLAEFRFTKGGSQRWALRRAFPVRSMPPQKSTQR